jgi:23S rRNA (adenine2030-N6)-methyltransferase
MRDLLEPWIRAGDVAGAATVTYPGSPLLAMRLLRPVDRLTFCEPHPAVAKALAGAVARDKRVNIVRRDGYDTLLAWAPPPERRGLVLIDPPFEAGDEFARLATALVAAWRKWPTGVFLAWYPRKDLPAIARFHQQLVAGGLRRMLAIDFDVAAPTREGKLAGCGLLAINPPFTLETEARILLPWLVLRLARGRGAGWRAAWIAGE